MGAIIVREDWRKRRMWRRAKAAAPTNTTGGTNHTSKTKPCLGGSNNTHTP